MIYLWLKFAILLLSGSTFHALKFIPVIFAILTYEQGHSFSYETVVIVFL